MVADVAGMRDQRRVAAKRRFPATVGIVVVVGAVAATSVLLACVPTGDAAVLPGCGVPPAPCLMTGAVVLAPQGATAPEYLFDHTGATLEIATNASVTCTTAFCTVRIVADAITIRGQVVGPIISLHAHDAVAITGGTVSAAARGASGGTGAGRGLESAGSSGGGGGFGGAGAASCDGPIPPGGGSAYGSTTDPSGGGRGQGAGTDFLGTAAGDGGGGVSDTDAIPLESLLLGSGGGAALHENGAVQYFGGTGGGVVQITSGGTFTVSFEGVLSADGGDGEGDPNGWVRSSGGGGSGGVVVVRANSWVQGIGGGTVRARGGSSSSGSGAGASGAGEAGGGGGGRVFMSSATGGIPLNVGVDVSGGFSECVEGDGTTPVVGSVGTAVFDERGLAAHCVLVGSGPGASFSCSCGDGFTGDDCTGCDPGFFGPTCSYPCPIGDPPCSGHGSCAASSESTSGCACDAPWAGDRCDECVAGSFGADCSSTCGYCGDADTGFCDDGVNGTGACQCRVGWAKAAGEAAAPSALCTVCADGWYGAECDQSCGACGVHGTCDDGLSGTGACECDAGWSGEACHECAAGYFGFDCSGFCDLGIDGAPGCGPHSVCDDGLSGRGCVCTGTWDQPAGSHTPCNECLPGYHGPECEVCPDCGVHGSCLDGVGGSGGCECDERWAGPGCDDCDVTHFGLSCSGTCPPCASSDGPTRLVCAAGIAGSGACVCPGGWQGQSCDTCGLGFEGAGCDICSPGFFSRHCLPCACGPNGVCDDGDDGTGACDCAPGWGGDTCQECLPGRYGATCRECPDCGSGGAECDDGVAGSGFCVCPADGLVAPLAGGGAEPVCCDALGPGAEVGDSCQLRSSVNVCAQDFGATPAAASGSGSGSGDAGGDSVTPSSAECVPGLAQLTRGYDIVYGRAALSAAVAVGFQHPWGQDGVDEVAWEVPGVGSNNNPVSTPTYRVPTGVDAKVAVASGEGGGGDGGDDGDVGTDFQGGVAPSDGTSFVLSPADVRADIAAASGITMTGGDASGVPDAAFARSSAFTSAVRSLAGHKFTIVAQHSLPVATLATALHLDDVTVGGGRTAEGGGGGGGVRVPAYAGTAHEPSFTAAFRDAVAALPLTYTSGTDLTSYRRLLTTFGTHIPTAVVLGGRARTGMQTKLCVELGALLADAGAMTELQRPLVDTGPAGVPGYSVGRGHWKFVGKEVSYSAVGGDAPLYQGAGVAAWRATVPSALAVTGVSLVGIDEVVARLSTPATAARAHNTRLAVLDYYAESLAAAAAELDDAVAIVTVGAGGEGGESSAAIAGGYEGLGVSPDTSAGTNCPGEPVPDAFLAGASRVAAAGAASVARTVMAAAAVVAAVAAVVRGAAAPM